MIIRFIASLLSAGLVGLITAGLVLVILGIPSALVWAIAVGLIGLQSTVWSFCYSMRTGATKK